MTAPNSSASFGIAAVTEYCFHRGPTVMGCLTSCRQWVRVLNLSAIMASELVPSRVRAHTLNTKSVPRCSGVNGTNWRRAGSPGLIVSTSSQALPARAKGACRTAPLLPPRPLCSQPLGGLGVLA